MVNACAPAVTCARAPKPPDLWRSKRALDTKRVPTAVAALSRRRAQPAPDRSNSDLVFVASVRRGSGAGDAAGPGAACGARATGCDLHDSWQFAAPLAAARAARPSISHALGLCFGDTLLGLVAAGASPL